MKKIVGIFICTLLIATVIPVVGQINKMSINKEADNKINPLVEDKWMKTFGDKKTDSGVSALQTSDGGYIVLGYTNSYGAGGMDFWLIKTDSSGNKLWDKTYGGENSEWATALQITNDGGYIMMGIIDYSGSDKNDIWLIKTDSEGNKIWDKTFGYEYARGYEIGKTDDGGYIITGIVDFSDDKNQDALLIKTDSEGNIIWNRNFGGIYNDLGYSVQQTTDGGYIILGEISQVYNDWDMWLIKTDGNGEMQWDKIFAGQLWDYPGSVQQTTDGGYIVLGSTYKEITFDDIWLIKTDGNGETTWEKTFTIIGDNMGRSVQQTTDGGYIILGDVPDFPKVNALLIKSDSSGKEEWRKSYGGRHMDFAESIQQTSDGGYILTGQYTHPGFLWNTDLWLIKTDANGNAPNNFAKSMSKYWLYGLFPNLFNLLEKVLNLN